MNACITVFTPTYNRAALIGRVYESLLAQEGPPPFEWVVVDDGSTDGTARLLKGWAAEAPFPVRYLRQENSGKHVAINRGVGAASGELFLIVDSDDWLRPGALAEVWDRWGTVGGGERDEFAGVGGHFADPSGSIVGDPYPHDVYDADVFELREGAGVGGDKLEAFRTEVLARYPFPDALDAPASGGGVWLTERIVWNRIGQRYKLRYFNAVIGVKDYQPSGITRDAVRVRARAPRTNRLYYEEFLAVDRPLPPRHLMRAAANHARFSLHAGQRPKPVRSMKDPRWRRLLYALSLPAGVALYVRDMHLLSVSSRSVENG